MSGSSLNKQSKQHRRTWYLTCAFCLCWILLGVLSACSGPNQNNPDGGAPNTDAGGQQPDTPPQYNYISPNKTAGLLDVKTYALPKELQNDTTLHINGQKGNSALVGGKKGLYQIVEKKLNLIDKGIVTGIVPWGELKVLIARPDKIQLWSGSLEETALFKQLDGSLITNLKLHGKDEAWIGTQKSLWTLKNDSLTQYSQIPGIRQLFAYAGSTAMAVHTQKGEFLAMRWRDKEGWTQQSFSDEDLALQALFPNTRNEFWGLTEDGMYQRKLEKKKAAWWPYRLDADSKGVEKKQIEAVALDPSAGYVWAVTAGNLYRLKGDNTALSLPRPKGMAKAIRATVSNDGALWVSDGKNLYRFGNDGPAVSFTTNVAPFLKSNCNSCHNSGKDAAARIFPFEKYEEVKKSVADMIKAIDQKRMPPEPKPFTNGDVNTLRRWVAGGYAR